MPIHGGGYRRSRRHLTPKHAVSLASALYRTMTRRGNRPLTAAILAAQCVIETHPVSGAPNSGTSGPFRNVRSSCSE